MIRTLFSSREHAILTVIAFTSASVSILALLFYAFAGLPMYILVNIVGPLSLLVLTALGVLAKKLNQEVFFNRLVVGAWAGIAATLAYDAIRYALWSGGVFSYNPFVSHPIFGFLITGQPVESTAAIAVGWLYHFWNGFGFGIMYTLVAGPARWWYALIWALVLEAGWILALPGALNFDLNSELLAISFIGHGAYGIALGLLSQRFIRE